MAIVPMCRELRKRGIDVFLAATDAGLREIDTSRVVDYEGVPAMFFPSQLGELSLIHI